MPEGKLLGGVNRCRARTVPILSRGDLRSGDPRSRLAAGLPARLPARVRSRCKAAVAEGHELSSAASPRLASRRRERSPSRRGRPLQERKGSHCRGQDLPAHGLAPLDGQTVSCGAAWRVQTSRPPTRAPRMRARNGGLGARRSESGARLGLESRRRRSRRCARPLRARTPHARDPRRGHAHVAPATQLRVLRPTVAAGLRCGAHLLVRVHLLRRVRRRSAARHLSELRGRARGASASAGGAAREVPRDVGTRGPARRLPFDGGRRAELSPLTNELSARAEREESSWRTWSLGCSAAPRGLSGRSRARSDRHRPRSSRRPRPSRDRSP